MDWFDCCSVTTAGPWTSSRSGAAWVSLDLFVSSAFLLKVYRRAASDQILLEQRMSDAFSKGKFGHLFTKFSRFGRQGHYKIYEHFCQIYRNQDGETTCERQGLRFADLAVHWVSPVLTVKSGGETDTRRSLENHHSFSPLILSHHACES